MMYDVRCMMYDVRCMMYDVRCMKHKAIIYLMVMLLADGCSKEDPAAAPQGAQLNPAAVSFATEVSTSSTRATTGMINNLDALKNVGEGFGVFAYLTDAANWETKFPNASDFTSFSNFFMQNQQVTWNNQWKEEELDANGLEVWHKDWVYSPLKYWPNYTNNADTSDGNDTPGPRYISFFAYAPWVDVATSPTEGVVNYTRSDDRTPHIIYKIGTADQQVDLLWAKAVDAKRNGNGLITVNTAGDPAVTTLEYQKVPLNFQHALSAIDIYVQRVYDEPAYTGKIPNVVLYPTLYISKLELTSDAPATGKNALQKSGKLSLIDGTWEDDGTWKGSEDGPVTITYDESVINDTIRGTANTSDEFIRDVELDKWKDAYGVSEVERNLIKNSMTQVLIPRKVTLIPTLTYSMVVRDDALRVNYLTDSEGHKYTRIINEVKGNSVTLDLVAGKRYTLLIRIGVEHISFELLSVVDWDFPMRFDSNVVTGFQGENESIGKVVNEE